MTQELPEQVDPSAGIAEFFRTHEPMVVDSTTERLHGQQALEESVSRTLMSARPEMERLSKENGIIFGDNEDRLRHVVLSLKIKKQHRRGY